MGPLLSMLGGCGALVSLIGIVGSCLPRDCGAGEHHAPAAPFTVDQAHRMMQQHRACRAEACPTKGAAFRALGRRGPHRP
jgi:hypothetical protein